MAGESIDFSSFIAADSLAENIGNKYSEWSIFRNSKIEEWKELRNYLYATDTKTTSNAMLPWSNSTTVPKLTQIMDNLHANYFAALFPSSDWLRFQGSDKDSNKRDKRKTVQAYMKNKLEQGGFEATASDLLYDYIQYGNCFASVEWEHNSFTKEDGEFVPGFVGPKLNRISPYDIVFNPTAKDFRKTPKIIRSLRTLGELKKEIARNPESNYLQEIFSKVVRNRLDIRSSDTSYDKAEGFVADGFSDIKHYYGTDYVEILTFYGDIYDLEADELMTDRIITVVDRAYVINNVENPSWLGAAPIFHAGWRPRPDNLYAMGPLDNLVGMQYRIDHLENLKADVFDQIAYPILKIRGDVEEFDFEPGARIIMGEEGDVGYLVPDATALNADFQIQNLANTMEEMAGAPRQAMGIRTPGEKTAFEVQTLATSASRIFEHKTAHFERTFLELGLNAMLEEARRKMNTLDVIRILDDERGVEIFESITKDDITANGTLKPVGARHFAERARRVQNLAQMWQLKASDPTVGAHLSGKEFARILSDELGEPSLFSSNISVAEQLETQQEVQNAQAENEDQLGVAEENGL